MVALSVIIPTRNRKALIERAIASVFEQRVACELIIVDDGSTDGTAEALSDYGNKIRLLAGSGNGPAAARNLGFRYASGNAIIFVDSDDILPLNSLASRIDTVTDAQKSRVIPFGRAVSITPAGEKLDVPKYGFDHKAPEMPLELADLAGATMPCLLPIFPRQALEEVGGFNELLRVGEDMEIAVRLHLAGWQFVPIDSLVYNCVQHPGERLTTTRGPFYRQMLETYRLVARAIRPAGDVAAQLALATSVHVTARDAAREGARNDALALFALAREIGSPDRKARSLFDRLTGAKAPYVSERILELAKRLVR